MKMMKRMLFNVQRNLKTFSWILCLSLLSMSAGVLTTGCADNRYEPAPGVRLDDSMTSQQVRDAFLADRQYKFEDVKVTTFQGTVQLSGFAATGDEKARAEKIARDIPGVKNVENNISVQ
jgi:hyperosmotically inducible periplasmic protein